MMSAFMIRTAVAVLILGVLCTVAWFYAPRQHFVGVSAVCYGFLIGWFAAWYSVYRYSRRQPG
jgi:uncharacterized membrane protein